MKGFIIYSFILTLVLLGCIPFAIRDMGWLGLMVIIVAGAMPLGSTITGIWAWTHGQLNDIRVLKKILHVK